MGCCPVYGLLPCVQVLQVAVGPMEGFELWLGSLPSAAIDTFLFLLTGLVHALQHCPPSSCPSLGANKSVLLCCAPWLPCSLSCPSRVLAPSLLQPMPALNLLVRTAKPNEALVAILCVTT